jgi:acyl-CoA thioesterase
MHDHPFADLIGLRTDSREAGTSEMSLAVSPSHLNPHGVVHGAVLYALADTGMGAALYPSLAAGEICATIEIKISYFRPVLAGRVLCRTEVLNRGRTIANLESRLYVEGRLVAQANGNYAILAPRPAAGSGKP